MQTTREMGLEAMVKEAHRLQEYACFKVVVAIAAGREEFDRKHMKTDSETEEETPKVSDDLYGEPFPDYDVSTAEACERLLAEPTPVKKTQQPPPTNLLEASVRLAQFRPICSSVDDLRALLTARADPNLITGPGQLSPLRSVILWARTCNVRDMRQVLFDHRAFESKEDKRRWKIREDAEMNEPAYLRNRHRDDREG